MPPDWALPKAWGEWAMAEYPQWPAEKVRQEGASFRDYWAAKSGKEATKLDWEATWRNWCRSDIAHRSDQKPAGHASARPIRPGDMTPEQAAEHKAKRDAGARRLLGFDEPTAPQTHEVIDVPSRLC